MDEAKQSKKGIYRLLGTQPTESVGRIKMDLQLKLTFVFPILKYTAPATTGSPGWISRRNNPNP